MARLGKHLLAQRAYDAWWPIKATTCWCNEPTMLGGPSRQRLVGATRLHYLVAHQGNDLLVQQGYINWWPNKVTLLGGATSLLCKVTWLGGATSLAQQASIAMSRMQLDVLYSMCLTNASRHALSYLMSMLCLSYVYLMSYVSYTTRLHCNVAHVAHLTHVAHVAHLTHVAHVARLTHASRHVLFYVS